VTQNQDLKDNALQYGLIIGIIGGSLATINASLSFNEPLATRLPLLLTLLLMFYFYLYKKKLDHTLLAFLIVTTVYIEILLKEHYTSVGVGIYFWLFTFPLVIFAFFTPIKSLLLNTIFLLIFLFVHSDGVGNINTDYVLFPLTFSYFTITIFNYIYQRVQDKQAEEIREKTKQLNILNNSLQHRIKKAVEESQSKDKVLEQQAKLAQMGELLSMISHQWRQPLGSIASATISVKTKIALEKYDLSKEDERENFLHYLSQKLDNIEEYTSSLSTTIDDFKNFYNPNKEIIKDDVSIAIKKALAIMESAFIRHKIIVDESYKGYCTIKHYQNELMQVILNILNNAHGNFKEKEIKNPRISLFVKEEASHISIKICDNGGGIPDAIIEKIFDPYFSTKDEKNGTGLGLYMSKTIIEQHHHGELSAYNKEEGACFSIKLPK